MGMFDTVIIEKLKLPAIPNDIKQHLNNSNASLSNSLQTKDLENALYTYFINEKGQVFLNAYKPTGKKKPFEPFLHSFNDNRSFLEKIYFKFKNRHLHNEKNVLIDELTEVKEKSNLTATFNAGSYNEIGGRYVDVEYQFVAVNGKIKNIKLISSDLEPLAKAKKRKMEEEIFNKKMDASINARRQFRSKWYYPVVKEVYNPFVFFTKQILLWAIEKTNAVIIRWHGV